MKKKPKKMTDEELETRADEILTEMESEDADLTALEAEARDISAEMEARSQERRRGEIRRSIAAGNGRTIRSMMEDPTTPQRTEYNESSPEYRSAWLKNVAICAGRNLFGEMTEEERAAFTHTTANSGNVVPTDILNRIVELVESSAPMYDDAAKSNMTRGFGVPRHTGTTKGDAKGVAEGTANPDDAQEAFDLLSLSGIELKKTIVISRKMQFQSIDAFADWVVNNLSERIAVAREQTIIARLDGTAPDGGSAVSNAGIDADNILTNQNYTDAAIRSIMGKLKGVGVRIVYANSTTIWEHLAGIADDQSRKLFVPNSMEDPIIAGRIYGVLVKVDENLPDNVVYFTVRKKLLCNDYIDTEIFHSMDPKTAADVVLGYALFDAGLENPKSAVKATFNGGA